MSDNKLSKIVIVGAGGNVGSSALKHLLATDIFEITVLSREVSTTALPSHASLTVKRGSYTDAAFISSVFTGQDAVLFAMNFMAMADQTKLIEAAAEAGVKWIFPTEYAGDGKNESMMSAVPMFQPKVAARKQIEELSKKFDRLKWVGIATNPWLEFVSHAVFCTRDRRPETIVAVLRLWQSLQRGLFGFDIKGRKATIYTDSAPFNSTTLEQAGLGIARLFSLPITNDSNPRASLSHYANNFVYISSCLISQTSLFDSLQKATSTTKEDWQIEESTIEESIGMNREKMAKGDMRAGAMLTYAYYLGDGKGGNYEEKAKEDREVLGLEEGKLNEIVKNAVEELENGKVF
ncbi:hypothetical protein LTR95_001437 [Oleoguttula sp. CCFEE 5521]